MQRITPPIQFGQQGAPVANLQEALLFIVEKRQLTPQGLSLDQRRQSLSDEMNAQSFGTSPAPVAVRKQKLALVAAPTPVTLKTVIAERL